MSARLLIVTSLFVLAAAAILSLFVGRYQVSPAALFRYLATGYSSDANLETVLLDIRLPRLIASVAAGGALSLAGSAYQGMFRNPMVSPDILGVSSGAGFGAALAILLSLPPAGIQLFSFSGGVTAVLVALGIARTIGRSHDATLVLVLSGIIISSLFGALLSLLKYAADPDDKLPAIIYWLMGSFADSSMKDLGLIIPLLLAGVIPLMLVGWRLNVLSFGDEEARSLGINTGLMRVLVIACATLVSACMIAVSGIIGWVGLVVPHLARFVAGPDHRVLLPVSFLFGGTIMLCADVLARSLLPVEIPVGIITAITGAPFFLWFLKQSTAAAWDSKRG
ncbi:FecCD family ABC transporter permease [Chlorobium phaeobacteroides]|uniref:Transport system permease protein n=1 Tax=Chlorobium phaeobacteroides (strain DSM 266 / SMG 266 / 2430) TaxID=290317 RepID=A1BDM6_CHLPD|nr:iron ABC transporter permease [Chlorobium phaeobacteroides]ABL64503.1 transport system permease protein [Chlorobium phaeobacteroides DSM 266]